MTGFERTVPSAEESLPLAVVAVPWPLALPWVLGLLILYVLKAVIYLVGLTVVLVIAIVQAVRDSRR
jgi:hypothetical protein